jgi:excisionase family DNA binding protein
MDDCCSRLPAGGVADALGWHQELHRVVPEEEVTQVDDEVLDVREAATLLGLGEDVVAEEAANGNLPGRHVGGQWRFARAHLLEWLRGDAGRGGAEAPGRRPAAGRRDFDRLLAAQPDAPPTPAEQAARDDNDALGDR